MFIVIYKFIFRIVSFLFFFQFFFLFEVYVCSDKFCMLYFSTNDV